MKKLLILVIVVAIGITGLILLDTPTELVEVGSIPVNVTDFRELESGNYDIMLSDGQVLEVYPEELSGLLLGEYVVMKVSYIEERILGRPDSVINYELINTSNNW